MLLDDYAAAAAVPSGRWRVMSTRHVVSLSNYYDRQTDRQTREALLL